MRAKRVKVLKKLASLASPYPPSHVKGEPFLRVICFYYAGTDPTAG